MKLIVTSDMNTPVVNFVVAELKKMGHNVTVHGGLVAEPAMWSKVAVEAARKVAAGEYAQGIFFCWTGTGISIAANKVKGIRAALCTDAETAKGARMWNNANVLAMSLRLVSEQVAKEILEAWFGAEPSTDGMDVACMRYLEELEK